MLIDNNIKQTNDPPFLEVENVSYDEIQCDAKSLAIMEKYRILILMDGKIVISPNDHLILIQEIYFSLGRSAVLYSSDKEKIYKRVAEILHQQQHQQLIQDDEASIVQYVQKLLHNAINKKASDVHLETDAKFLIVRFRIDGLLVEIEKISKHFSSRVIAHLKILAQLDITEKRLPQDGRLRIFIDHSNAYIDCRLSTCPMINEEKCVLRLLNTDHQILDIERLGFSSMQKEIFLAHINKPQGLILVTGPTGSGKTVTLYTALNLLNKAHLNILSVEDPIEIELQGINQVQVDQKIDLTFSRVLRSFLRQDPDIIMIGEMRDKETADIAIKAAQTGHLVLSTLHTNSAAETLTRLINMGIPAYDVVSSVSLIIAQRLVRTLCENCKTKDHLSPYCVAIGCSKCHQGYSGRIGIYEFLKMTSTVAETILLAPHSMNLEKKAKEEGMQNLYENGLEKINMGLTTLSELSRVMR